ncbi:MAG: hypothetical protein NWR67_10510 [Saprospiraceae bacterium]|nr:hypothetical protein [Saprospiraceae bacterium]MDP4821430.1 hypothetical protein [Saprospiraceae bacterium]MDP4999587.1 hypothetical protein [Saprospiraceae bacterium]
MQFLTGNILLWNFSNRSRASFLGSNSNVWRWLIVSGLFCCIIRSNAQGTPDTASLLWQKSLRGTALRIDRLDQLYVVNQANELVKFNLAGEEQARYNQNRMGPIGLVDPFDPFSVVVYYPEFQVVQVLDRTLNLQWSLDFNRLDLLDITTVGASNDKNIWAIDRISNRLLKFNPAGKILTESPAFTLLSKTIPNFTSIQASGSLVYAFEPGKGFWVFDQFGQFVKPLSLPGITHYQLFDNQILYYNTTSWQLYDLQAHLTTPVNLPTPKTVFSFALTGKKWILLHSETLLCFLLPSQF